MTLEARIDQLRNGWSGNLLSGLAGILLTGAFAPFSLWPLAILALLILNWQIDGQLPKTAALRGWLFGVGLFGSGASWVYVSIHHYGGAGMVLAGALSALFCLALAILILLPCWLQQRLPRPHWWRFPALWVLCEWLRSWLLTGFPWLFVGTSQIDGPLGGWFPLLGVYGGSLLVAGVAGVIYALLRARITVPLSLASLALILTVGLVGNNAHWTRPSGKAVTVALVQGNVPQELKWAPGHLHRTLSLYQSMSDPYWGTDLVVWPEAAIPAFRHQVSDYLDINSATALENGTNLLVGIPVAEPEGESWRLHNSVLALGKAEGLYLKRHLVPFGEYVPFQALLRGLIELFNLPMSRMSPGPNRQAPLRADGLRLGTFICYEIVYPDLVAAGSLNTEMLLTVSNDTWFGASIGPLQHLQMARLRALETGKPLIRATNNGVSALIDDLGTIVVRGEQFTREVVAGSLQPMQGATPYARWRSWPTLALCSLLILLSFGHLDVNSPASRGLQR